MNALLETKRLSDSPEELIEKFQDAPDWELHIMASRWFPENKTERLYELRAYRKSLELRKSFKLPDVYPVF